VSSTEKFALGVAIALGALVRVMAVADAPGATGDGGLFLSMIDDVRTLGAIPDTTSFNQLDIPFQYPPLSVLLAAGIGTLTGIETMQLLHWLPVTVSILVLGAFAWLALEVLPRRAAIVAAFAYALMPHAFDWVIAGGGLTRGLGLLFAIGAAALVADRDHASNRRAAAAGILLGLSALSHPQAPVFGVLACLVFSWQPPLATWLRRLGIAAAAGLVVALPWFVWVFAMHGSESIGAVGYRLDPLIGLIQVLSLRFAGAPFMDVFAVLGAIGLIASLARGQLRLPILLLAVYLTGAGGGEFMGAVAWALLAGVGGHELIGLVDSAAGALPPQRRRVTTVGLAGLVLFLALIGSFGSYADKSSKLQSLNADHLVAMRWLADNVPGDARIMVPTNEWWGDDEMSEWLPAVSLRHSIGTVQGSEWLGRDGFQTQLDAHIAILECARSTAACYASVDPGAILFIPKGRLAGPFSPRDCCPALRATLEDSGYVIVYDGAGATIATPSN
jgi:hypothetical protein